MNPVRIIGIDPGFDRLGISIIDKNGTTETLLFSTCIITSRKDTFEKRLSHIGTSLETILQTYTPEELAIEALFFTTNQKTVITVAEVRGVCIYLCHHYKVKLFEYSPPQIKLAIAGHGKASKEDIAHMVPKILGITLPKKTLDDELDAIAIALTHSANRQNRLILERFS
ncbi:MAG: crossover junction endodeoxyribonuclease RuvC, crossover junction endodeoxyribonuclease RuvC [Candidatus Parcubacteria bacterium]|jgi:crossover junction endodeoxyribonuclease RuvC